MIQATERRELFTLQSQDSRIHGTHHFPASASAQPNRTGMLFLPGFPLPRAAHGDAAVYWANAFAECGYPCFRIDLPGVGDSSGKVPVELLDYTATGGYERVVLQSVQELVARYGLTGMVIVGHCAGAISALFAAPRCPECHGLILLDPPFYLQELGRRKVKKAVFYWTSRTRVGVAMSYVYDRLKKIWLHLRKNALPANANLPMLKHWKSVASAGLPILVLSAPALKATGAAPRVGKFDYLQHILRLAGSRNQVQMKVVEGANHSFSNPTGRAAVRQHVEDWMLTFFPSAIAEQESPRLVEAFAEQDTTSFVEALHGNSDLGFLDQQAMLIPMDVVPGN